MPQFSGELVESPEAGVATGVTASPVAAVLLGASGCPSAFAFPGGWGAGAVSVTKVLSR
jgi:hypothetical protein